MEELLRVKRFTVLSKWMCYKLIADQKQADLVSRTGDAG